MTRMRVATPCYFVNYFQGSQPLSYSTEETGEIPMNTPFSILGSTQMPNAAKLIARMDHGQGLIDRFLFTAPLPSVQRLLKFKELEIT